MSPIPGSNETPRVGVLAIQGSFALHRRSLERCGARVRDVRKPAELEGLQGLVVPGGESTTMALLAEKYDLFEPVRRRGSEGLPILGTCAGAILLGRPPGPEARPRRWELADVEVSRNAYGRQLESFAADLPLKPFRAPFHCIFIRAPKLRVAPGSPAEILARHDDDPILVRCGHLLLATFHPELTDDLRVHRLFLEMCTAGRPAS